MSIRSIVILMVLATLMVSCGEPPTRGQTTTLESACDKANDGKRVTVEGYLTTPDQVRGDTSVNLLINGDIDRADKPMVAVNVAINTSAPNTMNTIPDQYTDDDLLVRTGDNQEVGYEDKVMVSGTVAFPSFLADKDLVTFTCRLDNPLIEKAQE